VRTIIAREVLTVSVEDPAGSGRLIRPPSLRVFLDQGGDLTGFPYLGLLVETVCARRHYDHLEERGRWAAWLRSEAECWLDSTREPSPKPAPLAHDQAQVSLFFWEADLLEDDGLYSRFVAALPEQVAQEERRLAVTRRPYRFEIVRQGSFDCQCCGGSFVNAPAIVLSAPGEGYSELAIFCIGCIATTAAHAALVDE
jgi:hypothetical protein